MVYKDAQHQSLHKLLSDTVSLLCRSGLTYQIDMKIEGLIGVTIDGKEVHLFNLRDVLSSCVHANSEDNILCENSRTSLVEQDWNEFDSRNNIYNTSTNSIDKNSTRNTEDSTNFNNNNLDNTHPQINSDYADNFTVPMIPETQENNVKLEVEDDFEDASVCAPVELEHLHDRSVSHEKGNVKSEQDNGVNNLNNNVENNNHKEDTYSINNINNNFENSNIDSDKMKIDFMKDGTAFEEESNFVNFENNQLVINPNSSNNFISNNDSSNTINNIFQQTTSTNILSSQLSLHQHQLSYQNTFSESHLSNTILSQQFPSSHTNLIPQKQPRLQKKSHNTSQQQQKSHNSNNNYNTPNNNLSNNHSNNLSNNHNNMPTLQQLNFYKSHPIICPLCGKRFPRRLFLKAYHFFLIN